MLLNVFEQSEYDQGWGVTKSRNDIDSITFSVVLQKIY